MENQKHREFNFNFSLNTVVKIMRNIEYHFFSFIGIYVKKCYSFDMNKQNISSIITLKDKGVGD